MKIASYKIESFINSLKQNQDICGALIYGPESGLVAIYADKIAKLIVEDQNDPFLISTLDCKKIDEDNALLFDEFVSIPMLGERKLIKINKAGNSIGKAIKPIFENKSQKPNSKNFILITAEELESNSSLRKFAEDSQYFAAIACYEDDESTVKNVISSTLKQYNLEAEQGVIELIINKFGKNRLIILKELEKLALYLDEKRTVSIEDIQNIISDISQISINEFINSFFELNLKKSNYFLEKLFNEKTNSIVIIRFILNYLVKLITVKSNISKGLNLEQEIRSQKIFFKQEAIFKKHLNIWNLRELENLIAKAQELEINCKSSNSKNQEIMLLSFNNFCFLKYKNKLRN